MWSQFYIPGDVFSELGGVRGVELDSKGKVPKRVCGEIKHTFHQKCTNVSDAERYASQLRYYSLNY